MAANHGSLSRASKNSAELTISTNSAAFEKCVDDARELLLFIAQYAGYPRAASMLGPPGEAITECQKNTVDGAGN